MITRSLLIGLVAACSVESTDEPPGQDAGPAQGDGGVLEETADYVFDDDNLRTYELTVATADLDWLDSNILLEEYVPATLNFEGREIGQVGLRYKGGFGTLQSCLDAQGQKTCSKLSMKLKFNKYEPDLRFYGLKKLNFHSMNSDPSQMHDRLAYHLYRAMGVAAPRAVHARLVINGEFQGLFALIEQIDGRFSRDRFADGGKGNVYKEVWPIHTTAQPYLDALKTNEDENPDVSPMIRFATELQNATDATIESVLARWLDLDNIMAFLAVDRAIENWDGIVGFWCFNGGCGNHNFYWYGNERDDFLTLIPWDMDNTFDSPNFFLQLGQPVWDASPVDCTPVEVFDIPGLGPISRRGASCDPLIRWLGVTLRPGYLAATETLLDGPFAPANVTANLDKWEAQIADAVAEDGNGRGTTLWLSELSAMRLAVTTLRAQLEVTVGR